MSAGSGSPVSHVPGVVLQDLRPEDPHLVDLAGVLDEVARHVGAGQPRVGDLGEQAVQRVAELVEQGADLVQGEQGGLAGGGSRQVEHVDHHRRECRTGTTGRRSCSSRRRRACPRGRSSRPGTARSAMPSASRDLPHPHVRVVADEVGPGHHLDAVQPARPRRHPSCSTRSRSKYGRRAAVSTSYSLGPDPLGVVRPVPRRASVDAVPRRRPRRAGPPRRRRWPPPVRPAGRGIRRWPRWS